MAIGMNKFKNIEKRKSEAPVKVNSRFDDPLSAPCAFNYR
jgi:hypothetical protein